MTIEMNERARMALVIVGAALVVAWFVWVFLLADPSVLFDWPSRFPR